MGTETIFAPRLRRVRWLGLWALYASASLACGSIRSPGGPGATGGGGSNANVDGGVVGTGGNDAGMSGGAGGSAGADAGTANCAPAAMPPQRLVRLAFSQLGRSITTLLGDGALDGFSIPNVQRRYFLPLATEGTAIDAPVLDTTISMVESAVAHNLSQPGAFAAASACADDDDCIRTFLLSFADRAFRRPLTDDERASVLQSYSEMRTAGLSPSDAGPYAVEGILISPAVVYRTEFGQASGADATLTPYERASQLAYFLSDGPPDGELRQAAATGLLGDPVGLRAQVDRYLQIAAIRDNLSAAMFAYYDFDDARFAVKDLNLYPDWTPTLISSMETEAQFFLGRVLWEGTVFDQLTSHRSSIDENLAHLYGVPYPAAPGSGFVPVDLPAAQRSGVLTLASWLAKTPSAITSSVERGAWINSHVICGPMPPNEPDPATVRQPDENGLALAKFRLSTAPCSSCHQFFDTYGSLLENYDAIGRFRTTYVTGEPIAPEVTLPATAGGAVVHDMSELAAQITSNGVFSTCLTASLIQYAGAAPDRFDPRACPVQNTHDTFWAGDRSFTSLVREVAVSEALSHRATGP